jgi:hypothetical protein
VSLSQAGILQASQQASVSSSSVVFTYRMATATSDFYSIETVVAVQDGGGSVSTGDMEADWIARSTAPGVLFTERFNDASRLVLSQAAGGSDSNGYIWTQASNISHEKTIKRSGGGSAKVFIPASAGADAGSLRLPLGQLRGNGTTTYYQFSIYTSEAFLRYKPTYSSGSGGWKQAIISHTSGSNQNNEVVPQDSNRRGFPHLYWQDGAVTAVTDDTLFNGSNFKFTPEVDRGVPASPANGGDNERRFGPIYSAPHLTDGSTPLVGTDVFSRGYPSPWARLAVDTWVPNGWYTILLRVTIGTLGSFNSTIELWGCQTGGEYQLLQSATGIRLGTGNGGHNAIWLLPYETNRNPNTVPQSAFVCYTEVIASAQPIAAPMRSSPSRLETLVASMSAGTWAQLTADDQDAVLGVSTSTFGGSGSNSMLPWTNTQPWNPITKKIEFIGQDHNYTLPPVSRTIRYAQYNELANAYELIEEIWPDGDTSLSNQVQGHAFQHTAVNPHTGDVYHRQYGYGIGQTYIRRRPSETGFKTFANNIAVAGQVSDALWWWEGPFSGLSSQAPSQGLLMHFTAYGGNGSGSSGMIHCYNPITGTWATLNGRAPGYPSDSYNVVGAYSRKKNVAVYGGGNGAPNSVWKMTEAGTVTQLANAPSTGIGEGQGRFTYEPASGNFLLHTGGGFWELNPDGAGTWTQLTGSRLPPSDIPTQGGASPGGAAVSIPEYGVTLWVRQTSTAGGKTYVYKHV